jgi:nucleoside-diphosphate-sugar epimerase
MILLTGATGFIGEAVLKQLPAEQVVAFGRTAPKQPIAAFHAGEISASTQYDAALRDVDVVIHTAARVHMMDDKSVDPLEDFRQINTLGTLNLAAQAAKAGVKRFIFISSVKVNGERSDTKAFCHDDRPAPEDAYSQSKAEAEAGLRKLAQETGIEVVIIRPPLVYGPGVKANFASILKLARKNLPLPLGAIHNKRSMVALDNLIDLIIHCISHPAAANQIFMVSDNHDLSTTELLIMLTEAAGKKPRLLPVPQKYLIAFATLFGKKTIADRLCGSLQVDITHTRTTLDWTPPLSVEEGIKRCFTAVTM